MQAHSLDREFTACVDRAATGDGCILPLFSSFTVSNARSPVLCERVLSWYGHHHRHHNYHLSSPASSTPHLIHPPFTSALPPFTSHHAWLPYSHKASPYCLAWPTDALGCGVTVDLAASEPSGRPWKDTSACLQCCLLKTRCAWLTDTRADPAVRHPSHDNGSGRVQMRDVDWNGTVLQTSRIVKHLQAAP